MQKNKCEGRKLIDIWIQPVLGCNNEIVLSSLLYRDSILTASTLFNVILFWGANRLGWERMAQGLLAVILITVPFIVYLQATAGTSW